MVIYYGALFYLLFCFELFFILTIFFFGHDAVKGVILKFIVLQIVNTLLVAHDYDSDKLICLNSSLQTNL